MKIVVNKSIDYNDSYDTGGYFALSEKAMEELDIDNDNIYTDSENEESRADPKLVEVVERLGNEANGKTARLEIIRIPDDVDWEIECDSAGYEWVAEKHRVWT